MTIGHTITGTYTTGVTLSSTSSNPVSVTGSISVTSGNALTGVGGDSWTIGNSGTILDTAGTGNGIRFGSFTTSVTNAVVTNKSGGLISAAGTLGYGVFVYGPGSVTNLSGGTITAGHIAVDFNSSVGTIINYGVILASSNVAAYEREGGVITNLAGGTISGATGVWFQYAAGTFTNAGTVIGSSSQDGAVLFNDQTSANLLIVDPGAVFTGAINGGLGALQLASASTTGTLSGFGATSITNFGTLQFDTGAKWTVAGNTSAAGLGTVAITGFTINDTIELTNFAAVSETFATNALVLTNAATAHATLHIQGSFTSGSFQLGGNGTTSTYITLAPPPSPLVYGQTIDKTGIIATSETVTAGTMTLFNSGSTAVGTIVVGTSLNTGDFTLKSDGSLGTDVIVNTVFGTYASGVRLVTNPATVAATAQVSNAAGSGVAVAGLTTAVTGLTNLGSIIETGTAGYGVSLGVGGVIINSTSALISAAKIGIAATSNYLTLNNSGTIRATTDEAVNFVTGTVVNSGLITGFYRGVYAAGATTVTNLAGGTITGSGTSAAVGVLLRGPTTVTNNGTVEGAIDGLELVSAAATLTNTGAVLATGAMSVGVAMLSGGTITNSTGGTIRAVTGIRFSGVSGALYNSGTVQGTSSSGVYISGGMVVNSGLILGGGASPAVFSSGTASITNLATGTISGGVGVLFNGSIAHTLINAGTITGTGGTAVSFAVGGGNVLIDDPGAVFIGTINGAAGLGPATIELASAASAGTISGFGSTVVNFDTLVFEPGALWTVAGSDSVAALGGVEIGGFSTGDTIDLTGFAATTKTFVNNVLTISAGTLHATLNMAGALNASNFSLAAVGTTATDITFVPGYLNYGETFDEAGLTVTSESVTAGVLTMFNGTTAIGTINVGTSLNTASFNLKSDGSGGTDVIVNTMVGTYAAGVTLVTNPSTIAATARIAYATNSANAVTGPTGTAWTLTNLGSVSATGTGSAYGVFLKAGGTVTNAAVILATGNASVGVAITGGGFVTNSAGAVITGGTYGVKITGAAGTVNNRGTIQGTNGLGIGFTAGGTVVNYGLIENTGSHHALYINGAGAVTNQASATITGILGVEFTGSSAHTLTNFGTITGTGGTAVSFSAGTNRVIDEAGAVFAGDVIGGGTSTMELAAGGAGTISGFGTSITNFNSLIFDPGAQWTVSGNDSASGLGTLSISGFSVGDTIDLNGFVAVSRTFAGSSLVLTNTASAHETLTLPGSFSTASFAIGAVGTTATSITLVTASLDYGQTIDAAGIVATSETVTAGTMTLFNSGSTAVGTIVVGTSLSTGDFTLRPDGSITPGTDVILNTVFGAYSSVVTLLTNPTTIAATATISNATSGSSAVTGPAGTAWVVTNFGSVTDTGADGFGIALPVGGTIVNAGEISGGDGVDLLGAGRVTNQASGTISSPNGFAIKLNGAANVTNNGTVEAVGVGIEAVGSAAVTNTGVILVSGNESYGIGFNNGGLLTNSGSGTIRGDYGVFSDIGVVTVVNSGTIGGTAGTGIYLQGGTVINYGLVTGVGGGGRAIYLGNAGIVSNMSTGTITAATGIEFGGTIGDTLVNAGTIIGGGGTAVSFAAGTNRLIDDPGAVFTGAINGGTGIAAVMELASGSSIGTISGFGSTITNFTSLMFDPGARWMVAGNASAGGLGAIGISGFTIGDSIDLTGFVATSETFANNALVLTNAATAHATLQIQGSFSSGNFTVVSDGATGTDIIFGVPVTALAYGQTIDETGIIATSETVTAGTMTLFNGGGTAVGTIVVGTSLNTGDFTLKSDGSGGTDVIVSTVFGTYINGRTLLTNPTTIASTASSNITFATSDAVYGSSGAVWALTNQGTLSATGSLGNGVYLRLGGTVINSVGGAIGGGHFGILSPAAGTITNSGTIRGTGGAVSLATGTVTNSGLLMGANTAAVYFTGAGNVFNQSGGTITDTVSGYYGIEFEGAGSVTNNGTILGGGDAVLGQASLTVINTGVITGIGNESNGIRLNAGGFVTNSGSGIVTGRYGIQAFAVPATIYNSGLIHGTSGRAIYLAGGTAVNSGVVLASGANPGIYVGKSGNVTNLSGGTITGNTGVFFTGGYTDTLTNAGTIDGTSGTAVSFDGAGAHLLIDDPGAVFTGAIFGGTTGNSTAVFELASGASAGTISGFGTSITNFTSLVFDTGADWTVSGNASANSLGTLAIAGFATGDTIDLTGFVAVSETFGSNEVTFSDSAAATVTLHLEGSFSSANLQVAALGTTGTKIYAGAAQEVPLEYGQTIVETGIIATSETVTAGILTLFDGASPVGTIVVGTSLSTGDFTLLPDGPSTEVIVKTVFGTYSGGVTLLTNPTTIGSLAQVGIATTNGDAVYGSGDQNWTLTNEGMVAATGSHGNGVYLRSAGVVVNESTIISTGTYGTGVYLQAGGVVTNTASGVISGQAYGVALYGTSTVVNSGTILGTTGGGLSLYGGTLNNAGLIADGATGLGVFVFQAGVVTNSASGTITAANNYGIVFLHTAQVTNAGTVESAETAIYADGVMTVANTGLILGTGTHGIGLDLKGGGQVTNNATGAIGGVEFGITAQAAAAVTNNGTIMGGLAAVYDKAALTVANTGIIDATGSNSVGVSLHAGGFVTNSAGGTITGAGYGVSSFGPATVENSGTILGTVRGAVGMFSGTVVNSGLLADVGTSAGSGIYIYQAGSVTNLSGGTITAASGTGIFVGGTANVVNNGTIGAGAAAIEVKGLATVANSGVLMATGPKGQGVYLKNGGLVTNSATGTISGLGYGVYLAGPGTVENGGTILGIESDAVSMIYGTVGNSGLIADSGAATAIYSFDGGIISNLLGGTITAATGNGIFFNGGGTVTNLGTIASTAGDAVSVFYGTVVNSNLIESGGSFAVYSYIGGNGSVTNLSGGTIVATTGVAIHIDGTAEVTNNGKIEGGAAAVYGASPMTVSNSGVVLGTSTGSNGMYLAMGGYVSNSATGTIGGGQYGIESHGTTTVVNGGTVFANAYGAVSMLGGTVDNAGLLDGTGSALAIYIGGNGSVTNAAGGTIMATTVTGIIIAGTGTVANNGSIEGGASAVYVKGLATVTNNGVILGSSSTSAAVHMLAGGFVTNSGRALISGGRYGILAGGTGTVDNSGTIQSSGDEAISLKIGTVVNSGLVTMLAAGGGVYLATGTVINSGTIEAGGLSGAVYIYGNGGVTNLAAGTIVGGYGVGFSGGYSSTVNNAGTIIGNAGTAVHFLGNGSHLLVDNPGAVFTGAIYGGNGAAAVFELASGASTGTIAGFGGTVTNFTSLVFDTGAQWIVSGNDLPSGLGTLGIGGFAAGNTIDMTGFVAVGDTFGGNEVTFANAASATATLHIAGSFSSANLQFVSDGSGGTDVFVGTATIPVLLYGQTIDQSGIIATSETVTAGTMTLFDGATAVRTIAVGASLNSGDFTLKSDGSGGTDVIVSTVFGTYASGVTLLTNPTTIANSARVGNAALNGKAVTGPSGTTWTVTNLGSIYSTGTGGIGVYLQVGGSVTNSGTIEAESSAVYGAASIAVTNTGLILSTGTNGYGVYAANGGLVSNSATGTISSAQGIHIANSAGTVDNSGTVAIVGSFGTAVYLYSGTVVNSGMAAGGVYGGGIGIYQNGGVTNLSSGTIIGSYGVQFRRGSNDTLANAGTIIGTGSDDAGVMIGGGGFVTNSGTGNISGAVGIRFGNAAGTVDNSGIVAGTANNAIYLYTGTVMNSGSVTSETFGGVVISHDGLVANLSTGTIAGNYGVAFAGGYSDTLANAGTIIGHGGTAVSFAGTGTHDLIVAPGAVFTGAIYGGYATGSTAVMELTSGASAGTISGFGGTVTNFTSLVFDPGARWTVAGNDLPSGLGSLGISGFAVGDTIDLTGFVAVSDTFSNNSLVLTDAGGDHATLAIQGSFGGLNFQSSPDGDGGTDIVLGTLSLTGTVPNQGVPNETPSHPFVNVVDTNTIVGAIETATVTLSAAGDGTLSNLSTGGYDAATGVYSVTGTPTADTAALQALVFTPIEQPNVDVVTTGFAISPGAGGAVDTTTNVTSVQQIPGLAAVPVNQIAISVSPDGSDFAAAVGGMTNEAVVTDPVQGDTYAVPAGYQALFLGGTVSATLTDTVAGGAYLVANSGNDELIAAAPNDILVPGTGNDSLIGGSFASTVVGGSGASTVFAGTGAMTVIQGSGPISFGGNGNAGSTISGGTGPDASPLAANLTGQNQTVSVGSSAATITAGGSGNVVIGGSSTLNVTLSGAADTVQAGSGASTVVSGGPGNMIGGGSGPLVVTETGNGDTISGGAGAAMVTDPTGTASFVTGGTGGLTFVGGSGTATVVGGTGATSVTAGAGGVIFDAGTSNNATVNSGSGTVTIFGAAGTTVNLTGTLGGSASQPNYVVAGPGGETLNAAGSSSDDWLSVNTTVTSSAATMIAGSGNDTLIAGSAPGSTTMTGGGGSDAFVFFKQAVGGAHDVINDFTGSDGVYIEGYGPGSAGALQMGATMGAAGLTLTLSDGTTITFSNLTNASALDGKMQYG